MAAIDDEVLAYAMAMGERFTLCEPLPEAKKVKHRELSLEVNVLASGGYEDRTIPVAQFIARLMSDRSFRVKKDPHDKATFHWVVVDGRTGSELHFEAPSEKSVRTRMAEASTVEVDAALGVMESATERLRLLERKEANAIVTDRVAEKKWPPAEGSVPARILALAKAVSGNILSSRLAPQGYWTHVNTSSLGALTSKLKSPAYAIASFVIHEPGSPLALQYRLDPSLSAIEVEFCKFDDASAEPVSKYEFAANVGDVEASMLTAHGKAKARKR